MQVCVATMSLVVSTLDLLTGKKEPLEGRSASLVTSGAKAPSSPGKAGPPEPGPIGYRALWEGHRPPPSPLRRAHSLSPKASEGPIFHFFHFCSSPSLGLFPCLASFSLITSGSETSVCSLSPWTQLCPSVRLPSPFSQLRLGDRHAPVHTCTHTQSFQLQVMKADGNPVITST